MIKEAAAQLLYSHVYSLCHWALLTCVGRGSDAADASLLAHSSLYSPTATRPQQSGHQY